MWKTERPIFCVAVLSAGICALLLPAWLSAQGLALQGPSSGFVFDAPSRSIRPIVGLQGAAYLGAPAVSDVDFAAIAPDGRSALAVRAGGVNLIRHLDSASPTSEALDPLIGAPDRIVWAANSSAAVLYSAATSRLQWLRVSDSAAAPEAPIDLSFLPGTLTLLAPDPSASRVLVGIRNQAAGGLYWLSPAGLPRLVTPLGEPAALAFANNGNDIYVVDRANRQILVCHNVFTTPDVLLLLQESDGISDPIGIARSATGNYLFVADSTRKSLLVYDVSSGTVSGGLDLDSPPSFVQPLSATSFLLNSRNKIGDPLWLLETRLTPAVYFVPASE